MQERPTKRLKEHPSVAGLLPRMHSREFKALKASIQRDGLRERIKLLDGKIVDGWHRSRACRELGLPYRTETLPPGTDPVEYALDANTLRRQITKSQLACIGAELVAKSRRAKLHRRELTAFVAKAARRVGCSTRYVYHAFEFLENDPDTFRLLRHGKMNLSQALRKFAEPLNPDDIVDRITFGHLLRKRGEKPTVEMPDPLRPGYEVMGRGAAKYIAVRCSERCVKAYDTLNRLNPDDRALLLKVLGTQHKMWRNRKPLLPMSFELIDEKPMRSKPPRITRSRAGS